MELNDGNCTANNGDAEAKVDSQQQSKVEVVGAAGGLAVGVEELALREFFEHNWGDVAFGD